MVSLAFCGCALTLFTAFVCYYSGWKALAALNTVLFFLNLYEFLVLS